MGAPLDPRDPEETALVTSDAQIPIKPAKENDESAEKRKGMNGFLVSLAGELMLYSRLYES